MTNLEAQINVEKMQANVEELSKAMTEKAIELEMMPVGCRYECRILVGPDGTPNVECTVVCNG